MVNVYKANKYIAVFKTQLKKNQFFVLKQQKKSYLF